jgi:hypothetical protein
VTNAKTVKLARYSHTPGSKYACAMEVASLLAGERWNAAPACVDQDVGRVMRCLNDLSSDQDRQRLWSYIPRTVGTRGTSLRWDEALKVFQPALSPASGWTQPAARFCIAVRGM